MVDTQPETQSLAIVWTHVGRRLAAACGALVALFALLNDVNLAMASLRGALCCIAVLAVSKAARTVLVWSAGAKNP